MRSVFLISMACLALTSCQKDETPVAPYDRGTVISDRVDLGAAYHSQVFYSLDQEEVVGSNLISDWDLAFEGGVEGWKVILNDGRMMTAWKSDFETIESADDSSGFGNGKKVEVIASAYSNPAMGDWRDYSPVYLVDLGYSTDGQLLGLYWIQILSTDAESYAIRYRVFGDSEITNAVIPKQPGVSFTRYSILNHETIQSPQTHSWDIKFTKYTYQFIDPPQPYLVTGLVLNPNRTAAAEITDRPFAEITTSDTTDITWSLQPDIIGYDWKYYDFGSALYEIDASRVWIIRTASGFYYKFRFTDYYDNEGNAGVPNFEFAKI